MADSGNLMVAGFVGPVTVNAAGAVSFFYALGGVDPQCASGAGTAANSCGIHIHSGMTCTGNALGHYFTGSVSTDPWTSVAYTSSVDGTVGGASTSGFFETLSTGGSMMDINGRAVIIHAHDGSRIACAILGVSEEPQLLRWERVIGAIVDAGSSMMVNVVIVVCVLLAAVCVCICCCVRSSRKPSSDGQGVMLHSNAR